MMGVAANPAAVLEQSIDSRKKMREDTSQPEIIIRRLPQRRSDFLQRHWLGGDRVASAWFTALSASFPRGEAFFIESLRANRVPLPAKLADEVATFIAQEANHAREHTLFNRLLERAGHNLSAIDARLADFIAQTSATHNFVNLAVTAALEHFTALIAHDLLARDRLAQADPDVAALWRWHAAEEIEHKAVAFDAWMHVASGLPRARRWKIRCLLMLKVSVLFIRHRTRDARELLVQDGMSERQARRALRAYLWGGALWPMLGAWAAWFRPGFHPWQRDDRALIADD